MRNYSTAVPARPHALDYQIKTAQPWNYAIVAPPASSATFNSTPGGGWSPHYAFNDAHEAHPFSIQIIGRRLPAWGFWRGSNITDVPPASPVNCSGGGGAGGEAAAACGVEEPLTLVPFGSTNIRIAVFPWVGES